MLDTIVSAATHFYGKPFYYDNGERCPSPAEFWERVARADVWLENLKAKHSLKEAESDSQHSLKEAETKTFIWAKFDAILKKFDDLIAKLKAENALAAAERVKKNKEFELSLEEIRAKIWNRK